MNTIQKRRVLALPMVFMSFAIMVDAQIPAELKTTAYHRITLEKGDSTYKFFVAEPEHKMKISHDYTYSWYESDTILKSKGGYEGRLLNGLFQIFFLNKNLAVAGNYDYGLKSGEWKSWYPDGTLKAVVQWKNGKRDGRFEMYDSTGNQISSGNYKDDYLSGTIENTKSDGKTEKIKYKHGVQIRDTVTAEIRPE